MLALLLTPLIASGKSGGGNRRNLKLGHAVALRFNTSSSRTDSDKDGLSNWTESHVTHTNPYRFDTDGDGYGDGAEIIAGSDPRNPASVPQVTPPPDTTAPETSVASGPAASTTATSASFAFSSNESGSSFQCRLDSGSWEGCTSPKVYSGLAVGSHTFSVRATDVAGNTDASPAVYSWTVEPPPDVTAPETSIESWPTKTTTSTSASFGFSANEGGSSFQCSLDSGAWSACTSPKAYSGLAVGSHTFSVRATDLAGNTDASPALYGWTVEPPPDTTAPETTVDSGPTATTTSTEASLAFSSNEAGSSFQCKLDSGSWEVCASPKAYGSLAVGSHTFSVRATDVAGNTDASPAIYGWTVEPPPDVTAPETSIESWPTKTTTSTSASFGFSANESGSSFQCKLDSGSWAACTSPKAYGGLAVGSHTFSVRATDVAGNTDASPAVYGWTVEPPPDTTAPETSIDSGPSGTTTSTSASFGFSANEGGSSFQCSLDSGAWSACTSPKAYSGLAVGSHTFSVRATDVAGNTDASPAVRSWTVQSEGGGGGSCTQTLSSGANLSTAVSSASGGAVICLNSGSYSVNVTKANKSSMVTIQPAAGASPTIGYSMLNQATNLRFQGLKFTGGIEALGPASKLQFVKNEFVGPFGFHGNGQQQSNGTEVTDVLFDGNYLHDLDYTGSQGTANGYGLTASNGVSRFTVTNNTIKSTASDYLQFASPNTVTIDHNTFLGPSLLGSHVDHQDLVQIFGGGKNVTFTNNVARNTETQESLLFQEGAFSNVVIENNLFDHDSRGYTCQLYQSTGMVFRNNTVVGSHWGCLFRDLASSAAGSGYQIDHNIFTNTAEGSDISTEGRAGGWGVYDYNVSEDGSASGSHSLRNWTPSWVDTTNYAPLGLPFAAGYRAP